MLDLALAATWRVLHPEQRAPFVENPRPPALTRLYYTSNDGWSSPLRILEPAPGGSGEPVVLAHALGLSSTAYRYGRQTLAHALQRAGFTVYLLSHRGDADAIAPSHAGDYDVDDIVAQDVRAALETVREHSGFARAFWVGHGLGGQLGVLRAVRCPDEPLAGLVCLNTAVRFVAPSSEVKKLLWASRWLPGSWVLPSRIARLATPWVGDGPVMDRFSGQSTDGARVRGVLRHGAEDVPMSLVRHVARWYDAGGLCDRTGEIDAVHAACRARHSLLVVTSAGDDLCRPAQSRPLLAAWGGDDATELALPESYGHDDVLFSRTAAVDVYAPVAAWLCERRRAAW